MAKKKKTGGGGDEAGAKRQEPLQAVLLADDAFDSENRFRPLTFDQPKVLCPLNNVTLLDYSLDFLAGAGVEQVFVVCVHDAVEEHVLQRTPSFTKMKVTVVKDSFFTNAGDALRELDKRGVVKSDPFILLHGDCVTNVNLSLALQGHQERRQKDPSAIMTLLMKRVISGSDTTNGPIHYSAIRSNTDDLVVGLDPTHENRLLVYDNHPTRTHVGVPCSFLATHSQLDLHTDLLDCGIDICSPDVLLRFSDEFDYRDIRREFVANSVAEEEEGLQNKIYAHLLKPNEYAARVVDFATYHAISQDLLRRWCYPVVPDNLPSGYEKQYRYALQRRYMYHEQKNSPTSRIGRSSKVQGPGMIGASCWIGEDCRIHGTVIGNHCEIASHVTLQQSHVWGHVNIEQGATVLQSILGHNCVIKAGAVVNRGCVIGAGYIVGANVVLAEFTRLTLAKEGSGQDAFDDDDEWSEDGREDNQEEHAAQEGEEHVVSDKDVVGVDGKGRIWKPPPKDDDDDEDEEEGGLSVDETLKAQSIGFDPSEFFEQRLTFQKEDDDDFSVDEDMYEDTSDNDYADGAITFDAPTTTSGGMFGRPRGVDAVKELKTICLEFESGPIENLAIELNSFKFSRNASYSDCTMAATLAILEKLEITKDTKDGKLVGDFKAILGSWGALFEKLSQGPAEEEAIIRAVELAATSGGEMGAKLSSGMTYRFVLQTLFDEDIVSEEAILAWAKKRKEESEESARSKLFQSKPVQDFLEWLEEESEEEDETDNEESSEE